MPFRQEEGGGTQFTCFLTVTANIFLLLRRGRAVEILIHEPLPTMSKRRSIQIWITKELAIAHYNVKHIVNLSKLKPSYDHMCSGWCFCASTDPLVFGQVKNKKHELARVHPARARARTGGCVFFSFGLFNKSLPFFNQLPFQCSSLYSM